MLKPPRDLRFDFSFHIYKNRNIKVNYAAEIILARDFIEKYYIHVDFQQDCTYKTAYEMRFKEGKLIDHSKKWNNIENS